MFYAQHQLDSILNNLFFHNQKKGFFVECGSFDGLTESACKFFEETLHWTGLNIEPVPYAFNLLLQNRPNCINENCALYSSNTTKTFTQAIHPEFGRHFGNGSLQHTESHKQELLAKNCTFETYEVQTIKFSDLYSKYQLSTIDLFVLDVEGAELEALKGILEMPDVGLPRVLCVENTIINVNDLNSLLSKKYSFHSTYTNNAFFQKKL